uniref:Uncharacterized protein n=1 Tax=Meloidogyne enterolobii TaxID=390850 RepID=A0A6V7TUU4_MELEN|nr:unnamed protein product [Meloidogyne enterolobii]
MLIFVDKIFEENKEISKEIRKEFTKIMNMLYLLRVLSDEEILLQDATPSTLYTFCGRWIIPSIVARIRRRRLSIII